jgi:hypothetical protein
MRKKLFVIIGMAGLVLILNAQTKLTYKNQALKVGDSHDFIFMKETAEGPAGPNVEWNFSELQSTEKSLTSHMQDPATLEKSKDIQEANTVIEEFGNQFYFNVNYNVMEQYGTVSCNTVTKYDKPMLKLKFPFAYGDVVTGEYSGVQISQNSKTPVKGVYEIAGDAYGTLILPGDVTIYNVLRVKQTRTIEFEKANKITEITYRWYTENVRYPLLVVIKYVNGKTTNIAETAMYAHVGENRTKSATSIDLTESTYSNFDIYPVPFKNELSISYGLNKPEKVKVELFDMSGRLLETISPSQAQEKGLHYLKVNNSINYKSGIYYVRLTIGDNSYLKKAIKQ